MATKQHKMIKYYKIIMRNGDTYYKPFLIDCNHHDYVEWSGDNDGMVCDRSTVEYVTNRRGECIEEITEDEFLLLSIN